MERGSDVGGRIVEVLQPHPVGEADQGRNGLIVDIDIGAIDRTYVGGVHLLCARDCVIRLDRRDDQGETEHPQDLEHQVEREAGFVVFELVKEAGRAAGEVGEILLTKS